MRSHLPSLKNREIALTPDQRFSAQWNAFGPRLATLAGQSGRPCHKEPECGTDRVFGDGAGVFQQDGLGAALRRENGVRLLFEGNVHFRIAARGGPFHRGNNRLKMLLHKQPGRLAENDNKGCPLCQVLLITRFFVRCQQEIEAGILGQPKQFSI